nr:MAG TPA: hypothetical protein [Caudoviricetes sp.]
MSFLPILNRIVAQDTVSQSNRIEIYIIFIVSLKRIH